MQRSFSDLGFAANKKGRYRELLKTQPAFVVIALTSLCIEKRRLMVLYGQGAS